MANKDKTQLITTWVVSPDQVSEIDRLAESHGSFMSKSHDREGSNALLTYDLSKGPELENPLDPSSNRTGNTRHVLSEVYDSPAGPRITGVSPRNPGVTSARWWRCSKLQHPDTAFWDHRPIPLVGERGSERLPHWSGRRPSSFIGVSPITGSAEEIDWG
jgi:hypothetical protein